MYVPGINQFVSVAVIRIASTRYGIVLPTAARRNHCSHLGGHIFDQADLLAVGSTEVANGLLLF